MHRHLLRVERPVVEFEPLIAAVRHQGGRVGWLELVERAAPRPETLEAAAACGTLRSVAIGGGRTVVVKPMRGHPVLRDVLREHFRGCALVLVHAGPRNEDVDAPSITPRGGLWVVTSGGRERGFETDELVAALRRPRPGW